MNIQKYEFLNFHFLNSLNANSEIHLSLSVALISLEAEVNEAAEIPLPVLDTVHVQEALAAIDGVEVVAEGAHYKVRVVAELGVAHELGVC